MTPKTFHIFAESINDNYVRHCIPLAPEGMEIVYTAKMLQPGVVQVVWRHEPPQNKPAAIYGVPAAPMPFDFIDGSGETWRMNTITKE